MSFDIRHAQPEDAPEMGRLMVATWLRAHRGQMPEHLWETRSREWTATVSEQGWRRVLGEIDARIKPHDAILLAVDAGTIAGMAACALDDKRSVVTVGALYILPSYQRRGLGRRLLNAVTAHYQELIGTMEIGVLAANEPARQFYETMGGTVVAERQFDEGGELLPEVVYGWTLDQQ